MFLVNKLIGRCRTLYCKGRDFRTSRKIIVFESDDWGSIRVPSVAVKNKLIDLGYNMNSRPYERLDGLESNEDVEELFNILLKYKDAKGNHPIITANMVMGNPDFGLIKEHNFEEYYLEKVEDTYLRYENSSQVLDLLKKGLCLGVVMPQFHGREHFNVLAWLQALRNQDEDVICAFDNEMCGIFPKNAPYRGNQFMRAYENIDGCNSDYIEKSIEEGLVLFKKCWGFNSKSFVAPCYLWDESIERKLYDYNVEIIQSGRPNKKSFNNSRLIYTYSGEKNALGQIYSVRNTRFEPAVLKNYEKALELLLRDIDDIFSKNKIAIISSHRINYTSRLSRKNRDLSLGLLDLFLKTVLKKYPDLEFLSTDKLVSIYD